MRAYVDDHEPSGLHKFGCAIWTTVSDPCNCKTTSPDLQRLSTAERLDLPADHPPPTPTRGPTGHYPAAATTTTWSSSD